MNRGRAFKGCCLVEYMPATYKQRRQKISQENIWNVPNTLTFIRVVITFATIYLIFAQYSLVIIAILFAIGMITDFLDGQIARKYKLITEFGRKFDMVADRFLLLGVAAALMVDFALLGTLTRSHLLQIFLVMSREIVTFPFALVAFVSRKPVPHARTIGKLTTFLQGFAVPSILLSTQYSFFLFAPYLAGITCLVGIVSAFVYINDLHRRGIS